MAFATSALVLSAAATAAAASPGQPGYFTLDQQNLSPTVAAGVNIANGNLLVSSADIPASDVTYGVGLARFYNSGANASGPIGKGWTWDAGPQVRLEVTTSQVTVVGPTGYRVTLTRAADGSFTAPSAEFDGVLSQRADGGFDLKKETSGETYRFSSTGTMTARLTATGTEHTVQATSAAGQTFLGSFGTTTGRRINLSYDGTPRVIRTDDPASRHTSYGYDAQGRLTSFSDASNGTAAYGYDSADRLTDLDLPDGTTEDITYDSTGRVAQVQVSRPTGVSSVTTYVYEAVDPDECDITRDTGQTTVTEAGSSTTFCHNSLGEITDVAVPAYEGLDQLAVAAEAAARSVDEASFAGVWTDDDDNIRVGFTTNEAANVAAVKNQVTSPDKIVGFTAARTLAQLQSIVDAVTDERADPDSGILYVGIDTMNNRVEVGAENTGTAALRRLKNLHGSALVLYEDEIADAAGDGQLTPFASAASGASSSRSRTAKRDPLIAGLRIQGERPEGSSAGPIRCTSGFSVLEDDSYRSRWDGFFTAGHCTIDEGQEWSQGGETIGEVVERNFSNGKRADAAIVDVGGGSDRDVDHRVYLATGRSLEINTSQGRNDDHVGNKVCFSGATTNRVKCGRIKINSDEIPIRDVSRSVAKLKSQRLATFKCEPGDSGAPVFWGRQAIGIVSALDSRGCWYTHIDHAERETATLIQVRDRLGP